MAFQLLQSPPDAQSFTPLTEHQSQTPTTFYNVKPVLHYHTRSASLVITAEDLSKNEALSSLSSEDRARPNNALDGTANTSASTDAVSIPDVDIWVTTESLTLFSTKTGTGVAITYPSISLHAVQRLRVRSMSEEEPEVQGLYMQLAASPNPADSEEEPDTIEVTLIPAQQREERQLAAAAAAGSGTIATDVDDQTSTQALFNALSSCADLHPDPHTPGSEENDEQDADGPPPGMGGWITAENMDRYFDEQGQFIGFDVVGEALGPGAGTVRARTRDDDDDGMGLEEEERERDDDDHDHARHADAAGENGKWRRTG